MFNAEFNQAWSAFKGSYENPKKLNVREIPGELATFKRLVLTNDRFIKEYFQHIGGIFQQITSSNLNPDELDNARKQLGNLSNSTLEFKVSNLIWV